MNNKGNAETDGKKKHEASTLTQNYRQLMNPEIGRVFPRKQQTNLLKLYGWPGNTMKVLRMLSMGYNSLSQIYVFSNYHNMF